MDLKITDLEIKEMRLDEKQLNQFIQIMAKHGVPAPKELLPKSIPHRVTFTISNTNSSFANALRRTLISEIPVRCLEVDERKIVTDDPYALNDFIIKRINLIPINQAHNSDNLDISLFAMNKTNKVIDVWASDITITQNKKPVDVTKLIPDPNVPLFALHPGKSIKITDLYIATGTAKQNAAKFSLLSNVSYDILDVEPYDMFTGQGKRSIETNPTSFKISYTTSANIDPKKVMQAVSDVLIAKCELFQERLSAYVTSGKTEYYEADGLKVTTGDFHAYTFLDGYITMGTLLAHAGYALDPSVSYITSTIDRYDNEFAIIKIKHPTPNKLLADSIRLCIEQLQKIKTYFK